MTVSPTGGCVSVAVGEGGVSVAGRGVAVGGKAVGSGEDRAMGTGAGWYMNSAHPAKAADPMIITTSRADTQVNH